MTTKYKFICKCNNKVIKKNIFGEIVRNEALEPIYDLIPCQYKTNDSSNFKKHQLNQHDYCRIYKCNVCNLKFSNSRTLNTHNRKNHATPEEKAREKALCAARNKRYRDSLNSTVS